MTSRAPNTADSVADIPHAPSTDAAVLDTLEHILTDSHVGEANAITSGDLAEAVGEQDAHDTNPSIRDAMRDLLLHRGVPVASGSHGYYIPRDEQDVAAEVESIRSTIGKLNKRKLALEAAAEGWDFDQHCDADGDCEDCGRDFAGDPYLWESRELCRECWETASRPEGYDD